MPTLDWHQWENNNPVDAADWFLKHCNTDCQSVLRQLPRYAVTGTVVNQWRWLWLAPYAQYRSYMPVHSTHCRWHHWLLPLASLNHFHTSDDHRFSTNVQLAEHYSVSALLIYYYFTKAFAPRPSRGLSCCMLYPSSSFPSPFHAHQPCNHTDSTATAGLPVSHDTSYHGQASN